MTDAELAARLRANLLGLKALQARTTALLALELPGVRALCLPGPGVPLFQQQVLYTHPEALAPVLPEVEAWYHAHRVPAWRVGVTPGHPAVEAALAAVGYVPGDGVPALGRLLTAAPPPRPPPGVTVEHTRELGELLAINTSSYAPKTMDVMHPWSTGPVPGAPLHAVLVREAGRALAGGMVFEHDGTAGMYLIATRPGARRRGLGALVVEALHAGVRERGLATAAVLQASADGLGVYQRLGYRDLGTWVNWVRRPENPAPAAAPG